MSASFHKALALIDAAHSEDPTTTTTPGGIIIPYELHYAQKSTDYLSIRAPNAPEVLSLAVRAQHLKRWEVPRASYPMTRVGYHAWRTFLKKRQAQLAAEMCVQAGYSEQDAERVAQLVRKEELAKGDEETSILEDVACLVFLDDQFADFTEKSMGAAGAGNGNDEKSGVEKDVDGKKEGEVVMGDVPMAEEKMLGILRKTWGKMSERGRELAMGLYGEMEGRPKELMKKALGA